MSFILASSSQRRQQLLKYLIPEYNVITADINEEELGKLARTPQEMVIGLAKAKAKKVFNICRNSAQIASNGDIIILGADTTVIIPDGDSWKAIGKSKTENEAKQKLQLLRNNKHQVYTGICLIICKNGLQSKPTILTDYDISIVSFGQFEDKVIDDYLATGTALDKAAYAIQDVRKEFKITYEGSYSNVVGLPIERLVKHFDNIGVKYNIYWKSKI